MEAVRLNLSFDIVPGLDAGALEREIRTTLEKAGIQVRDAAPVTLFVRIEREQVAACPGLLVFRTHLALSEEVEIRRGVQIVTVYADTWRDVQDPIYVDPRRTCAVSIEPTSKAGDAAGQSALDLVVRFLDAARYTATVMNERPAETAPE